MGRAVVIKQWGDVASDPHLSVSVQVGADRDSVVRADR